MRALLFWVLLAASSNGDEEFEFWEACETGDVGAMRSLLLGSTNLDLEYHDDNGRTPLLLTVLGSHREAAALLLSRGARVEATGRWPGPEDGPLAVAAAMGDLAMMDLLVEAGASVGAATGPDGRTPLTMAAANGRAEAVRFLLGVGAPVDARRRDGTTAACWAARGGHADTLQVLLDHGADVASRDDVDGSTPLHFAAQAQDAEATRVLLSVGADLLARTNVMAPTKKDDDASLKREELRGGMTALMSAASAGSVANVDFLLSHARVILEGDDDDEKKSPVSFQEYLNAVDVSGLTAMAWACSVPNRELTTKTLELLDANGARDDSLTVDGRGLMHVAASGRNARAIAWLVDVKGHAVDSRSPGKRHTPLLIAAFQDVSAQVNAAAPDGATPLISAASAGQKSIVKLLLKRGADPLRQLKSGEFPSQVTPKTPRGKMLKWALSKAERKAWFRLEFGARRDFEERGGSAPPDQEEGIDDSLVEDLDEEADGAEDEEEGEDDETSRDEL